MRPDEAKEKSVYGRNVPVEGNSKGSAAKDGDETSKPDDEQASTGDMLEEVRRKKASKLKTGGMGRAETPKGGPSQGEWHSSDDEQTRHVQKSPQNEMDTDEVPD